MKKEFKLLFGLPLFATASLLLTACSKDDDNAGDNEASKETSQELGKLIEGESQFGKANDVFSAEEWYPGGQLGTTESKSYSDPVPSVDVIANGQALFKHGEDFFEHLYTYSQEPRKGLGPAWVRSSCIHCHPSYGHGKRQTEYKANTIGNGYLLVVYHPNEAFTSDGVRYTTLSSPYISEVTGMPQTKAMTPFKAPIDENQISIQWKHVSEMPSGLPMQFPDGESYDLIYPEVNIPQTAFNTSPLPTDYEVRLESTIGIYGTGLIDAISQDDMKAVYKQQSDYWKSQGADVAEKLNPNIWDAEAGDWATGAWYTLADGTKAVKKFTYAMTRASLQDGAGANAIWNITNVSRLPLLHPSMGQGTGRRPRSHQLHQAERCCGHFPAPPLLCRNRRRDCHQGGDTPGHEHGCQGWRQLHRGFRCARNVRQGLLRLHGVAPWTGCASCT